MDTKQNVFGIDENILKSTDKESVEKYARALVDSLGYKIVDDMADKPWGIGFRFDDSNLPDFLQRYYADENITTTEGESLSPKFLFIAPNVKLSWQYHFKRSELWKVIGGKVGVVLSDTDEETQTMTHGVNDLITVSRGKRHRIVGLDQWGLIAEIWQHADADDPSSEEDIVRISDDFGREGTTEKR